MLHPWGKTHRSFDRFVPARMAASGRQEPPQDWTPSIRRVHRPKRYDRDERPREVSASLDDDHRLKWRRISMSSGVSSGEMVASSDHFPAARDPSATNGLRGIGTKNLAGRPKEG